MGLHLLSFFTFVLVGGVLASRQRGPSYEQNYNVAFGAKNVLPSLQDTEIRLLLDQSTGSGIQSKSSYSSGFFHMNIKLSAKDTAGVVTAFYLTSRNGDELDFEFLGNLEGHPYTIQTNVFTNGQGGREQRIRLWFDPTASFHTYRILWNEHQIVFYVDKVPIRVFKNKRDIGVGYPAKPMQIVASIWNGDSWATGGGKIKINWGHAPFEARFRSFGIDGCSSGAFCYSSNLWWNREQYWKLSPGEEKKYQVVKRTFMNYDYCKDRTRYQTSPPECPQ